MLLRCHIAQNTAISLVSALILLDFYGFNTAQVRKNAVPKNNSKRYRYLIGMKTLLNWIFEDMHLSNIISINLVCKIANEWAGHRGFCEAEMIFLNYAITLWLIVHGNLEKSTETLSLSSTLLSFIHPI